MHPYFNPECECFVVLMLNTRRRVKGHYLVSIGTMDALLVHPREVFRLAIMTSAAALVLAHNHPSGDSTPSEADIRVTHDLIRAGQLLKIEVLDHVVIGNEFVRKAAGMGRPVSSSASRWALAACWKRRMASPRSCPCAWQPGNKADFAIHTPSWSRRT
jgi:hypothetical protein